MTKYLFIYHAPMTPADAAPPTPEQMEAVMGQWNAWAGKVGDRMVDFGTPLAGGVRSPRRAPRRAPVRWPATRSSRPTAWTTPSRWPRTTLT